MGMLSKQNVAHIRKQDKKIQALEEHLENVSQETQKKSSKISSPICGKTIGLLHDLGKYSSEFQNYIKSSGGLIDCADADYVDSESLKGKIPHAPAGTQYIWQKIKDIDLLSAQTLSLTIMSHHSPSGLMDCLRGTGVNWGEDCFTKYLNKPDYETHLEECKNKSSIEICFSDILECHKEIQIKINSIQARNKNKIPMLFEMGLFVRFLYSCLIDSDRTDSADFEKPNQICFRNKKPNWKNMLFLLESSIEKLKNTDSPVNFVRQQVYDDCKNASNKMLGIFSLTAPTGSGKTLNILLFAIFKSTSTFCLC